MSISSTLTNLMNAVRSATGESNKMNIDDAIKLLLNITPFDKVGGVKAVLSALHLERRCLNLFCT